MYNSFQKNKSNKNLIILIFLLLLFPVKSLNSQTKTNLNIFYTLIDSAVYTASKQIPSDQKFIHLNLKLGNLYSIFEDKIISDFSSIGKKILPKDSNSINNSNLNFTIENSDVKYGEMFRNGLFGSFYVPRTISISGNYIFPYSDAKLNNFKFAFTDSVKVDNIKEIENSAYPFTRGQLPSEPFFPSLIEPVIAIGATALAVILFFTVRSK